MSSHCSHAYARVPGSTLPSTFVVALSVTASVALARLSDGVTSTQSRLSRSFSVVLNVSTSDQGDATPFCTVRTRH